VNRTEKEVQIKELAGTFTGAECVYLVNLSGLTVPQVTDLRRRIKGSQGSCRVVKNRLAIRGAKGTATESLAAHFRGPVGVVSHRTEPVSLAKILSDFGKDHPAFSIGAAVVSGQLMVAEDIKKLASLPGLNELRATLLGLISAPASRLVRVLAAPGGQVARVVEARRKALGGE
jgi:large subunit ribosomal protein L10